MALWLTQSLHGLADAIIALGAAAFLAALGIVRTDDLGRIAWPSLLTFGGGLALGVHLTDAGVADWIASNLAGLSGLPSWLGIAVVAAATLALTTVASNTATAAMLVPLALPLAGVLGVDPAQLVVTVAIASSLDFALVIGTPPTMFAYSTGLFTPGEIFRKGVIVDLMGLITLIVLAAFVWTVVGLV
jgi:sodium-dependent dicarboxylate transporter 2/3/5